MPSGWKIIHCDNCRQPVCPDCLDNNRGINLCPECNSVVEGLSSVKVMEALLRRRRQNRSGEIISGKWNVLKIIPGGPHLLKDRIAAGVLVMATASISFNLIIRNGLYFKDPRFSFTPGSVWRIIVPLSVIALTYLVSLRLRKPEGARRYYVLPQDPESPPSEEAGEEIPGDYQLQTEQPGTESVNARKAEDPFGTFIDSI
jgi:hypothetical protein